MAKKKSDPTEASDERGEIERRVDAMMSVERPADKPAPKSKKPAEKASDDKSDEPMTNEPTAPQLPARLLKSIGGKSTIKIIPSEPESNADTADDDPPADDTDESDNNALPVESEANEQPSPEPAKAAASPLPGDPLEDTATDEAVDDIMVHEADLQLAVDDVRTRRLTAEAELQHQRSSLRAIFTSFWTWLIIIGIAGVVWAWYH